jgi:hypothetical protein
MALKSHMAMGRIHMMEKIFSVDLLEDLLAMLERRFMKI